MDTGISYSSPSLPKDDLRPPKQANEREVAEWFARTYEIEFIDEDDLLAAVEISTVLDVEFARSKLVVSLARTTGSPRVAMADPSDVVTVTVLRGLLGPELRVLVSPRSSIELALRQVYSED